MFNLNNAPGGFMGLEERCDHNSRFAVLPIAFDGTSTYLKGADKGPDAILTASANVELYDIETELEPYVHGIATLEEVIADNVDEMISKAGKVAASVIANGNILVGIGGEHSVSIPLIREHAKFYENFSVLQLDAHSDTREEYEQSKFNHACVMARVAEMAPYVQVGIRSMDSSELRLLRRERTVFAHEIHQGAEFIPKVIEGLEENVYVTLDLDVFDSSIMPSTGTPEPGGLNWSQVTNLLREVAKSKNIVGFDVVELMPIPDIKAPDFLAAKLIYQTMAYIIESQENRRK